jgi:hypothetical protein
MSSKYQHHQQQQKQFQHIEYPNIYGFFKVLREDFNHNSIYNPEVEFEDTNIVQKIDD